MEMWNITRAMKDLETGDQEMRFRDHHATVGSQSWASSLAAQGSWLLSELDMNMWMFQF